MCEKGLYHTTKLEGLQVDLQNRACRAHATEICSPYEVCPAFAEVFSAHVRVILDVDIFHGVGGKVVYHQQTSDCYVFTAFGVALLSVNCLTTCKQKMRKNKRQSNENEKKPKSEKRLHVRKLKVILPCLTDPNSLRRAKG